MEIQSELESKLRFSVFGNKELLVFEPGEIGASSFYFYWFL